MGEGTTEWKHASWVSPMGKWAWIVALINGILNVAYYTWNLFGILAWNALYPFARRPLFWPIWSMIWGVAVIVIAVVIIRPRFSNKCGAKDWDALYNWVLKLGKLRLPWMLVWGVFISIFGFWGWGGVLILIPTFVLLFAGPKEYKWMED